MSVRRQTDEMFQQLRALFAAGRIAIRGPGRMLDFIREVDRQTRELDRVMRERLAQIARRQLDEARARRVASFSADHHRDAEALGARVIGFDPGGQDSTAWCMTAIASVHLEDDGVLERDERSRRVQCTSCGRLWDDLEIVQTRDLASIGIGRRRIPVMGRVRVERSDGGHVGFVSGPVDLGPGQVLARGATIRSIADQTRRAGFTMSISEPADIRGEARDTIENREVYDAMVAAGRGWGMSATNREAARARADTGQLRRTPMQRDAAGSFTVSIPLTGSGPATSFEAIMRAIRPPVEVAPEHAKKLGEPSPKLPTYRPT